VAKPHPRPPRGGARFPGALRATFRAGAAARGAGAERAARAEISPPRSLRACRARARVKELVDLYEPFLLGHEPVFEANHIEELAAALSPDERESFGYDPRGFDWYDYWIDVHIPGLRRWSYPLLEGKPVSPDGELAVT
jgi:long-chain acyl-CoA synthetase